MRRRWLVAALVLLLVVVVGYIAAGAYVYMQIAAIGVGCRDGNVGVPSRFKVAGVDTQPYLISRYDDVRFQSRDPRITVAAWFAEGPRGKNGNAVVLVHGLGDCRGRPFLLLPAGMLYRHGVSVLMIDLRDHGDSTFEDGRHAGGTEEYLEVLGAWDWLRQRGYAEQRIGLFGESLGAGTVLIAAGEEQRVAAVWEDSGYASVGETAEAELRRNGYPTWLEYDATLVARMMSGDDLATLSPINGVRKLGVRPLFITHGANDERLDVAYAYELAGAYRAGGGRVEPWIVPTVGHIDAVERVHVEYERRLTAFFDASLGK